MNRAADVALAGLGLALTSPLLAAAALAIKLEDGGPILFRQSRVGKDGVDFDVLKLRTMVVGAEGKGAGYAVDRGDARITSVGRVLRRTSIDELPAALERRPWRYVGDWPTPDAALPGRRATPSASGDGSGCGPVSRAGRRSTDARRFPGPSASSSTCGTSSIVPRSST